MEIISSSTVETNQTTRIFFCNKQIKVYFRPPYLKHVFVASHFLKFNVVRKKNACRRVCSSLVSMVTFFLMFLLGLLMYITFEPTKVLLLQSQKCNTECKLIFENTYSAEIIVLNCLHIPVPYWLYVGQYQGTFWRLWDTAEAVCPLMYGRVVVHCVPAGHHVQSNAVGYLTVEFSVSPSCSWQPSLNLLFLNPPLFKEHHFHFCASISFSHHYFSFSSDIFLHCI